jgi:hypothetical protein
LVHHIFERALFKFVHFQTVFNPSFILLNDNLFQFTAAFAKTSNALLSIEADITGIPFKAKGMEANALVL